MTSDKQKTKGERTAPRWCRAAYKPVSAGVDTSVEIHAEDGAAFLCERTKKTTLGWFELSRMVPYGHNKRGESPSVIPACSQRGKQPSCKVVTKRLHILTAIPGATLAWMDDEAPKNPRLTDDFLTLSQYWAKRNGLGHSSSSDESDNVLKAIKDTGCQDQDGRYTYRGNILGNNKKFTVGAVIVDPYGREHEGKKYFCFTEKGVYLALPPSVHPTDPKPKAQKLYAIAKQLYNGTIAPASYYENEDDDFAGSAYDAFVATYHANSGAHAGPSTTSRPGSRGSATGQPAVGYGYGAQQPATGSRPSSRGNAGPAGPATQAYHSQQQYYQQPHPQQPHPQQQGYQQQQQQQQGYKPHPQQPHPQQQGYQQQQQQQYYQQHPQQQQHHQPTADFHPPTFAHAGPSQPVPAPAAQTAANLPYRPELLTREGKKDHLRVLFDPDTEHYIVKGVSDTKPNKAYQIFWSDKRQRFYVLKTVTESNGKKKTEPVYLKDLTTR